MSKIVRIDVLCCAALPVHSNTTATTVVSMLILLKSLMSVVVAGSHLGVLGFQDQARL